MLPFCIALVSFVSTQGIVYSGYWTESAVALSDEWSGIATDSTGENVFAIRSVNSGIYFSSNYGQNFFLSTAPYKSYRSIACSSSGNLIAAIADDLSKSLVISTNTGETWSESNKIENCLCWQSISISSEGNYMVAVGTGVGIYYSWDSGDTWTSTVNPSLELNWTDIKISTDGKAIATSKDSGVWFSLNGGESWGMCNSIPLNGWTNAAISSDGNTLIAVNSQVSGGVYVGYSDCQVFLRFPNVPDSNYTHVAISNTASHLMISSNLYSYSFSSNNSGNSWNPTDNSPQCSFLASSGSGDFVFATDESNGISYFIPGSKGPGSPTLPPTLTPTQIPTAPTYQPSNLPTGPTSSPTLVPSMPPSSSPTHFPSSYPTTPRVCPEGTYEDTSSGDDGWICKKCVSGTYSTSTNASSSETCQDCPYPTTNLEAGSSTCSAISLHPNPLILYIFGISSIFLFLFLIGTIPPHSSFGLFVILIMPLFDILTDLLYLLTSTFYNKTLFFTSAVILCYPFILFSYRFLSLEAYPIRIFQRMFWLGYSSTYLESQRLHPSPSLSPLVSKSQEGGDRVIYPTIFSKRFSLFLQFASHDTIFHLLFEILNWIIAILLQILTCFLIPFCCLVWFLFGIFLETTKLIHITSIWNLWFRIWTSSDDFLDIGDGILDTHSFHYAMLFEFFLETFPQLILQGVNNTLVSSWTSHYIGIISFVISCLMALNVAYRYLYHARLQSLPTTMKEIPIQSFLFRLQSLTFPPAPTDQTNQTSPSYFKPYTKQISKLNLTIQESGAK
jgi:photosystem II stability/assembly factor-like uncharacterized protein